MRSLEQFRTAQAPAGRLDSVRQLLDSAFGGGFSADDWEHSLGGQHFVILEDGLVVAHAAVIARQLHAGDRLLDVGYVEGVGVLPSRHGSGLGSEVMTAAGRVAVEHYEMGALSTSRVSFYARLGWELWTGPSHVAGPSGRVRTPDDDGGIMVLRGAPSADVDLSAPITCESRSGDNW